MKRYTEEHKGIPELFRDNVRKHPKKVSNIHTP